MKTIEEEIKIADAYAKYLHECCLYTVMFVLFINVSNLNTETLTSSVIITVDSEKNTEIDKLSLASMVANVFSCVNS
jgi:hypothetical protein